MKRFTLIVAAAAALSAGCASHQSSIDCPEFGRLKLPKDASWESLTYTREHDTNGRPRVSIEIRNAIFKMNPDVLDAKTRHAVALIKEGANLARTVAGAAAK